MEYLLELYNQEKNLHINYTYNVKDNIIKNEKGEVITLNLEDNREIKKKKLTIQLGFSCNMSCSYCLQSKTKKKSFDIEKCKNLIEKLKKENLENTKIEFWGGEPLLYIKEILYIVRHLKHNDYLIITNGMLLNLKLVKFLMKHNFTIILSHDAQSQNVRGKNPLDIPNVLEAIKYLYKNHKHKFGINSVITNGNINTMERLKYFANYLEEENIFEIPHSGEGPVYNTNLNILSKDNLSNKIYHDIIENNGMKYGFYSNAIVNFLYNLNKPISNTKTKCGIENKDKYKIFDINNKELTCHNYDYKFNINTIKENSHCETCIVRNLCKGGCPAIDKSSEIFKKNCEVMYETNTALLRVIMYIITNNEYQLMNVKKV